MIKSDDNASLLKDHADSKSAACWHREPNTPAVRFELTDGEMFVFPYQHLICAVLRTSKEENHLKVTFVSHEVTIQGRRLFPLLKALQGFSLEWVCALPSLRHAPLKPEVSTWVWEVAVHAVNQSA